MVVYDPVHLGVLLLHALEDEIVQIVQESILGHAEMRELCKLTLCSGRVYDGNDAHGIVVEYLEWSVLQVLDVLVDGVAGLNSTALHDGL